MEGLSLGLLPQIVGSLLEGPQIKVPLIYGNSHLGLLAFLSASFGGLGLSGPAGPGL